MNREIVIKAQVIYGVRGEMAQKLKDVVLRRTELGSAGCPGDADLQLCAQTMAKELGWSSDKIRTELEEVKEIYKICPS